MNLTNNHTVNTMEYHASRLKLKIPLQSRKLGTKSSGGTHSEGKEHAYKNMFL
jgi:hypothetical protein